MYTVVFQLGSVGTVGLDDGCYFRKSHFTVSIALRLWTRWPQKEGLSADYRAVTRESRFSGHFRRFSGNLHFSPEKVQPYLWYINDLKSRLICVYVLSISLVLVEQQLNTVKTDWNNLSLWFVQSRNGGYLYLFRAHDFGAVRLYWVRTKNTDNNFYSTNSPFIVVLFTGPWI